MKKLLFLLLSYCFVFQLSAQETFPTNGPSDERQNYHAFTNATVVVSADRVLKNATLVTKNGKIVSVTENGNAPAGTIVHNLEGKTIYPSFIELNSGYGVPAAKMKIQFGSGNYPQYTSKKKGAFGWNEAIHPEVNAAPKFIVDKFKAKDYRKNGFGTVLTHIQDGIARGTGTLVTLADASANKVMLNEEASSHFSFSKGTSRQQYPSSLMGSIALLRQSHYDADWYKTNAKDKNLTLDAWNKNKALPSFMDVRDVLEVLRADKIADEIGQPFIIVGNGDEYQKIDAIKATNAKLIIPVNFPKAYDVEDPITSSLVSYTQMKHWEMAPHNASFLNEKQIPFAFTSSKLAKDASFIKNIKQAAKYLGEKQTLKALTTIPASYIQAENQLGTLEKGKLANFIITDGNLFTEQSTKILENWVQGKQYFVAPINTNSNSINGNYFLKIDKKSYQLKVAEKSGKTSFQVTEKDSVKLKTKGRFKDDNLTLRFITDDGVVRLSGWRSGNQLKGIGVNEQGAGVKWFAKFKGGDPVSVVSKKEDSTEEPDVSIEDIRYPFVGYGWTKQPEQQKVLFQNVTVWTNEDDGILKNTDVLIKDGKILKIGKNLSAGNAIKIDGTGKHLTAGVIDEHSHIGISRGVNEGTQASSAEVRIGDVINSEHIGFYRVLAGGVTTSQLLHGSANPIGGQSAIVKSRWGLSPEEMKFEGADGFIKFALGENVKQSNWGSQYSTRYPQTRMGVEQVYDNYFTLAREYEQERMSNPNARRNLELDAIAEIINSKRFITCHSYVQSEINMLMKTAERHGFRVNTFTHILEGYKVADKMKKHGVGGSTFSDWWAYKYEVIDAIPYNATMLNNQGVVTAINSDDAEMARRLNQEAAKAIKYGGASEEDAWKMVTLNPAKLLHIDDKVGSIKVGKDADIVLWSDHPMSVYAKAEQTYVDGRKYFDIKENIKKTNALHQERERIIQKMLNAKAKGAPTQKVKKQKGQFYSCKHLGQEGSHSSKHHH